MREPADGETPELGAIRPLSCRPPAGNTPVEMSMTMQSDHHEQSFIYTAGGQAILLLAALVVLTAIAWFYLW